MPQRSRGSNPGQPGAEGNRVNHRWGLETRLVGEPWVPTDLTLDLKSVGGQAITCDNQFATGEQPSPVRLEDQRLNRQVQSAPFP